MLFHISHARYIPQLILSSKFLIIIFGNYIIISNLMLFPPFEGSFLYLLSFKFKYQILIKNCVFCLYSVRMVKLIIAVFNDTLLTLYILQ
jgi:hypothetical protein